MLHVSLREKCPNTELFGPNKEKYGPEITPYLDTFHAVFERALNKLLCNTSNNSA